MLQQKLDNDDRMLALILQDPILCMEFLRSTADLARNKDIWPKKPFQYRPYQKDLLSDKTEHIVLEGGRSIGKCQLGEQRIYTEHGYQKIEDLRDKRFRTWAWHPEHGLRLQPAIVLKERNTYQTYRIKTAHNTITVTGWHPIWTTEGWKNAKYIVPGDRIAQVTRLPHMICADIPAEDARMIGYFMFKRFHKTMARVLHTYKNQSVINDITKQLAKYDVRVNTYYDRATGDVMGVKYRQFKGKTVQHKAHEVTDMLYRYGFYWIRRYSWNTNTKQFRLPREIHQWNERALKNFFEAFFAEYAEITTKEIRVFIPSERLAIDLQELLLRFGIETKIEARHDTEYFQKTRRNVDLVTLDHRAAYRILRTFTIPGYIVGKLSLPPATNDPADYYRYEDVVAIERARNRVYAVQVAKDATYITENIIVHNSFVLEDKLVFDILNNEQELVDTPETVIATSNQSQMTPVLDRLNRRFMTSPFLRGFVVGPGVNRQKGTMEFNFSGRNVTLHARIAGQRSENNMIGLHVPKLRIDEGQVFATAAFQQVMPIINQWEENTQVFICGVPNNVTNSALYYTSQRAGKFKKYRIPSPNNPYYTHRDFMQAVKDHGGTDSDLFKNLVLGRWGSGSEQVIRRDELDIKTHDFYNYTYTAQDKIRGKTYLDKLDRPYMQYSMYIAGIDTGFVDPTIIQIFGLKGGQWYLCARYRLQRIEYPEQEIIIDWLHQFYNFATISLDISPAGGGATILQSLLSRAEYKTRGYNKVLLGVQFTEHLPVGYAVDGKEIMQDSKTLGASELVRIMQGKQLVFAELDGEGISEVERIARTKTIHGAIRYFVMSRTGRGASDEDHIFASLICFAMAIRDLSHLKKQKKKLGKTQQ